MNRSHSQKFRLITRISDGSCVSDRSTLTISRCGSSNGGCPNQDVPGWTSRSSATVEMPIRMSGGSRWPAAITAWLPRKVLAPNETSPSTTVPRWIRGPHR